MESKKSHCRAADGQAGVWDAERSLLAVQDSLLRSDRRLGQHMVRLYRALGGGGEVDGKAAAEESKSRA